MHSAGGNAPSSQRIVIPVYDVLDRQVKVLFDGGVNGGLHELRLDGRSLASGIFVVRMEAGDYGETRAITLLH